MQIRTGPGVDAFQSVRPDNKLSFNPSPVGPGLPNANNKQSQLNHSADVLAKGMQQIYGDDYKSKSWTKDTLEDIANTGKFHSKTLDKDITVSPELQQAAKNILANGGSEIFDRKGDDKDGIFNYDDLQHYISENPNTPSLFSGNQGFPNIPAVAGREV